MATLSNKIMPKLCPRFSCEICDYSTSKKSSFDNHLDSKKHKSNENEHKINKNQQNYAKLCPKHICAICNMEFKDRSGLWRHKKKCTIEPENKMIEQYGNPKEKDELINFLLKENSEFKVMMMEQSKQMLELAKNVGSNNTTYNNSHNKTFNLQVFLNETCKDAMNIMDFVNSMEIELDDLEKVGELGYVNGMTNIIVKNLRALDITKRPLHCTDAKREILYIKDDNKWEKETENKDKMKLALKYIVHKNAKMFNVFKAKYPDCIKSYSSRCDQYNKLVVEVLGGKGDNEAQNNEKIIRRIAREVIIDKAL
jgi:hypothetical protein